METLDLKQSGKKSGGKIFLILFLTVFALGFGALGFGMVHSAHKKTETCSAAAEGRIVGYKKSSYNHKRRFSPIVEYQVENQIFTDETNVRLNYRPFKEGEHVLLYYNPDRPDEFYIKGYDLKTTYKIGAIFLLVAIGIFVMLALFSILGRIKMDKKKKDDILAKIIIFAILLLMFTVFSSLAGLRITICLFAGAGLFSLYGIYQSKHKK